MAIRESSNSLRFLTPTTPIMYYDVKLPNIRFGVTGIDADTFQMICKLT